jgi:hypothetical protein
MPGAWLARKAGEKGTVKGAAGVMGIDPESASAVLGPGDAWYGGGGSFPDSELGDGCVRLSCARSGGGGAGAGGGGGAVLFTGMMIAAIMVADMLCQN